MRFFLYLSYMIKELYKKYSKTYQISTDTRNIVKGAVFFALKGKNFNANQFAEKALYSGASHVVIDDKDFYKDNTSYILVENVLQTLQELATYHRKKLGIPIIALTGSNGKTTTKELIKVVLSKKYRISATKGNLNNHIGVPLTLLSMTPNTEIGIVEMGANHFDEISFLCKIAQPNYGYITNFGKAHLEGFGSIEGVIKAKTELYNYLKKNEALAFVNKNDKVQIEKTKDQKQHLIGSSIKNLPTNEFVKVQINDVIIESNLLGDYNYNNISTAIGIGLYFDVPLGSIKSALENYIPNNQRSQLIEKKNTTIILDAYNANPTSMQAAIKSFRNHHAKRKIVILGDMFELGESAEIEHQLIAELASDTKFEKLVLLGENFYKTTDSKAIKHLSFTDFKESFNKDDYKDVRILIKGSRGMALERIVDLFE